MSDVAEEPKLDVETAVFYDTLLVLAEAVKMLNFHAFLGPTQVSCLAERSWESGATFFNYINSVETNGITGKIRFEVRKIFQKIFWVLAKTNVKLSRLLGTKTSLFFGRKIMEVQSKLFDNINSVETNGFTGIIRFEVDENSTDLLGVIEANK